MSKIAFANLPLIVRFATMISYFMAWVMVEEFVIDRHGLDQYLPFYRVGNLCVYDIVAAVTFITLGVVLSRAKT